jgi:hypothetical protein
MQVKMPLAEGIGRDGASEQPWLGERLSLARRRVF